MMIAMFPCATAEQHAVSEGGIETKEKTETTMPHQLQKDGQYKEVKATRAHACEN